MFYIPYGAEKYVKKRVAFLLKALPTGTQQHIYRALDEMDLNVKYLAEKDIGYPSFKNDEFSEAYIKLAEEEFASACTDLNLYLKEARRPPFFHHPEDTCRSAKEFLELMKKRPYEELVAFFDAPYEDYEPESWPPAAADCIEVEN